MADFSQEPFLTTKPYFLSAFGIPTGKLSEAQVDEALAYCVRSKIPDVFF